MDIAAVLDRLARLPVVADRMTRAAGRGLAHGEGQWFAAFAFHDVGKLSPRFHLIRRKQ